MSLTPEEDRQKIAEALRLGLPKLFLELFPILPQEIQSKYQSLIEKSPLPDEDFSDLADKILDVLLEAANLNYTNMGWLTNLNALGGGTIANLVMYATNHDTDEIMGRVLKMINSTPHGRLESYQALGGAEAIAVAVSDQQETISEKIDEVIKNWQIQISLLRDIKKDDQNLTMRIAP